MSVIITLKSVNIEKIDEMKYSLSINILVWRDYLKGDTKNLWQKCLNTTYTTGRISSLKTMTDRNLATVTLLFPLSSLARAVYSS